MKCEVKHNGDMRMGNLWLSAWLGIYDLMGWAFMAWVGRYGKVSLVWKYAHKIAGLQGSTLSNHCMTQDSVPFNSQLWPTTR